MMRWTARHPATATAAAFILLVASARGAGSVELIEKLDCALTQMTHAGGDYCLKVFNTCNTPIVSRIETGGVQKDGPEIRAGQRGEVCSPAPFAFLGHYITGPLAEGAGD